MQVYNFEQRSPEWYKIREGKITGTSVVNILGKEGLAKTNDAIDNLAMELAIETCYGMMDDDYVSFDMQRGIESEPRAFELLWDRLAQDFITCEKVGFIERTEHVGVSPDGIAGSKGIEIKCPKPKNFFKLDFLPIDEKYYKQMQHQMYCGGFDSVLFVNYCVHFGKEYMNIKEVKRDVDMISLIDQRCAIVTKKKLKYIEQIKSNNLLSIHEDGLTIYEKLNT